jgi:two-component system OmpR family sensor kinase
MVHGDLDALGIVLRNLLENALHYGDPAQPIRLRLHGDHSLSVANGSAVVPAEVLATLTQRFRRLEASKPGSGLGLAIAETVMRQIGGRLELHSPVRGEAAGFEVVLRFPPQG